MALKYRSTQTATKFHLDNSFVRLLFGSVGCGKSVANCVEIFKRGCEQEPGSDGIRRSRWGVVRNTYPELKSTTIKTWLDWFPESEFGKMRRDSPITHILQLPGIEIEVIFLALDSEDDVKKLMSFEFTGIYINELQYIHPKIFDICQQRVNRYPSKRSGANITWSGVIADTNPPSTRHWIYDRFEKNLPSNFSIFKYQPAVLIVPEKPKSGHCAVSLDGSIYINNPEADYLNNLPTPMYYLNQVPASTDERIKVFMRGEYGVFIDGKPIHPEYRDRFHYANKELTWNPHLEIGLGWDFGLTPACAVVQFNERGQLIGLGELYSDQMGLRDFTENIVIPFLDRHFPGWQKNYISRHDPAGQTGSQTDMVNCQQILKGLGIHSLPAAENNAPTPRREGLKYHLRRLVDGEPGFILSSKCQQIREGLMGNFQYGKIHSNEDALSSRYHEKPLKNEYSHICEALEYIAMWYAHLVPQKESDVKKDVLLQFSNAQKRINEARRQAWYK